MCEDEERKLRHRLDAIEQECLALAERLSMTERLVAVLLVGKSATLEQLHDWSEQQKKLAATVEGESSTRADERAMALESYARLVDGLSGRHEERAGDKLALDLVSRMDVM